MPIIPATQKAEIGRIMVHGQPMYKVSETISANKSGMIAHTWSTSYVGDIDRRVIVPDCSEQKLKTQLFLSLRSLPLPPGNKESLGHKKKKKKNSRPSLKHNQNKKG
jgi:hypothetical protein